MSSLQPQGEMLRQAVRWISDALKEDENAPVHRLIQKASSRFNLSPKDEEFLMAFYKEKKD
ncbi:MAG: hypothetical protein ABIK28_24780 [Planctomycetota bacterium]